MAIYAKVERRLWRDEKVRLLSDDGKTCFVYLLTCPHGNLLGMYVLPAHYGAGDLKWTTERFAKAFGEVLAQQLTIYDEATDLTLVRKYLIHNPIENPNQVTAGLKALAELPTSPLFAELDAILERLGKPFLEPLRERLAERYAKPVCSNSISNSNKDKASLIASTDLVASPVGLCEPPAERCPGCLKHQETMGRYLAQCQRLDMALTGARTLNSPKQIACHAAADAFCAAVMERDIEWCRPDLTNCYGLLIEPRLKREINAAVTQTSSIRNRRSWAQTWLRETLTGMVKDDDFYSTVGYRAKGRAKP